MSQTKMISRGQRGNWKKLQKICFACAEQKTCVFVAPTLQDNYMIRHNQRWLFLCVICLHNNTTTTIMANPTTAQVKQETFGKLPLEFLAFFFHNFLAKLHFTVFSFVFVLMSYFVCKHCLCTLCIPLADKSTLNPGSEIFFMYPDKHTFPQ